MAKHKHHSPEADAPPAPTKRGEHTIIVGQAAQGDVHVGIHDDDGTLIEVLKFQPGVPMTVLPAEFEHLKDFIEAGVLGEVVIAEDGTMAVVRQVMTPAEGEAVLDPTEEGRTP